MTAILAARADFPLDRLADAVLVSDAISAHASDYISGSDVGLVIEDGEGSLDFRVGPLHEGGGEGLLREMEVPGLGQSLERLVDEVKVERGDGVPARPSRWPTPSSSRCASASRARDGLPTSACGVGRSPLKTGCTDPTRLTPPPPQRAGPHLGCAEAG